MGKPIIIGNNNWSSRMCGISSKPKAEDQPKIKPQRKKIIPPMPSKNGKITVSDESLLAKLLNVNPGVFFGDNHGEYNCAEYMAAKMPFLKQQGVSLFFMEMFSSDAQPMLDRYFKKGDNKEELISYLKKGWDKSPGMANKYFEIVQAARLNGIRIIGIDNEAKGNTRLECSNPHWTKVINNKTPNNKYIVFGGHGHSANYPANKGVDYRLGIPSIDLETGKPQIILGNGRGNDFRLILQKSPNQPPSLFDN